MNQYGDFGKETEELMTICERNDRIPPELFKEFGVKRGLRDVDGTGVLAGISNISRIDAFKTEDGKKVPCDGQLWYRGYNVIDLIHGFEGKRFGFEEVAYLLLFGELPDAAKLGAFKSMLEECRQLPTCWIPFMISSDNPFTLFPDECPYYLVPKRRSPASPRPGTM